MRWLSGSLAAPDMNLERVGSFFGDKHQFPGIDHLRRIAHVEVPVNVRPAGDLAKELAYENYPSAGREKAVADVAGGRTIGFSKEQAGQIPGFRVSPVGVVEEREHIIIIHDMNFEHRDGQGGGVGKANDRLG